MISIILPLGAIPEWLIYGNLMNSLTAWTPVFMKLESSVVA